MGPRRGAVSHSGVRVEVFRKVVWSRECPARGEAMKLQRTIKKRGIGRYLRVGESAESRPAEAGD